MVMRLTCFRVIIISITLNNLNVHENDGRRYLCTSKERRRMESVFCNALSSGDDMHPVHMYVYRARVYNIKNVQEEVEFIHYFVAVAR